MDAISRLHLTHLSVNLECITEPPSGLRKSFSNVTHLDLLGIYPPDLEILIHFTSLTHLALSNGMDRAASLSLFSRIPKLQMVLHLRSSGITSSLSVVEDFNPDVDDPRIIELVCGFESGVRDWLDDVEDGRGLWQLASGAVVARMKVKAVRCGNSI
ncbi:hypothetical protein BDN72DRAFT_840181 [Pluteus cervinus]|uniref:Uncharacterized protein n=1 Tax=Pluteus cervinus TaxID=181527 RepID=A0ACD3AV66_9AGAR|nr:hypothetical protein BDN72DRAFT_840181 [Pluteus cervinus]